MQHTPILCLTFDNLGAARSVFDGKTAVPDHAAPDIVAGIPNVLRSLRGLNLRATFFVEGWSALHYPDAIKAIVAEGHEIGLHGWIHEPFAELNQLRATQYITDGVAMLAARGVVPKGFRAPGGKRGSYAEEILLASGFKYDSSVETGMSMDIPRDTSLYVGNGVGRLPSGLMNIPWEWFMIDAIHYLLSPDGIRDPFALAEYWGAILRNVAAKGGVLTVIFHAHVSGVASDRLAAMERFLHAAIELGFRILPAHEVASLAAKESQKGC
ncbi:polysaccharide deacetylase family protein [Rhizobium sp. CNPSo 3464]|uniref:polysaccharide deacetylase family protein n=1 Tax=Rhizobium sp. CNPSo 3464 TaxID=3021406 RepID=UPI00254ADE90|nr:polysaccharide deacetylase family protein [Rhizobium sp. CNPSo 3464]MDK4742448.1 polysaccharide deacetylase family protein [Rhizobium sp. CNPSo 3464]